MISSVCVTGKNQKFSGGLTGRGGTRAPQRPARQIFDGVNTTPRHIHDRVLAVGYALNASFPNLLQHIKAHDHKSDRGKAQRKQRKGRQKLANEVELQREHAPQKPPHPFPLAVFDLHLSSVIRSHLPDHLVFLCLVFGPLT